MKGKNKLLRITLILITMSIIATSIGIYLNNRSDNLHSKREVIREAKRNAGQVKACGINPPFALETGMQTPLLIDLRQKGYRGMRIIDKGGRGDIFSLPSWESFGWLGLYTLDNEGNIYLSSVPHESIVHNPVGEQNRILKVDKNTGEMSEYMQLPQAKPSTIRNPFGAMGLHYECDNSFLYVASVAGSGMKEELGRIYQIDITERKIISQLDGVDALGLSTFNTINGKRLFFGLARKPVVYSVGIDKKGRIKEDIRLEFSLIEQPGGAYDKAHRIRFKGDFMEVKANEFSFTLAASSDPEKNIYNFKYNRDTDKWDFIDVYRQKQ